MAGRNGVPWMGGGRHRFVAVEHLHGEDRERAVAIVRARGPGPRPLPSPEVLWCGHPSSALVRDENDVEVCGQCPLDGGR